MYVKKTKQNKTVSTDLITELLIIRINGKSYSKIII